MVEHEIPSPEASINSGATPLSNPDRLVRANGTEPTFSGRPSLDEICRLIDCDTLDTVRIGPRRAETMFVDDTGMLDGKTVNTKATALYHACFQGRKSLFVHGDVVIVPAGGLA
jgi:hypothetical protein